MKNWLVRVGVCLALGVPSAARAQIDFSTSTPLTLYAEMAADTVTNALFNHYAPHPEMVFTVVSPVPGADLIGDTAVLIALDFDNDGFADIFQGNRSFPGEPVSRLLINEGDGSFRPLAGVSFPDRIVGGAAGDLDNDGWTDFVVVSALGSERPGTWHAGGVPVDIKTRLMVLRNGHGRELAAPEVLLTTQGRNGAGFRHPVLQDFNGDSRLDLAVVARVGDGGPAIMVWYGAPTGFSAPLVVPLDTARGFARAKPGLRPGKYLPMLATVDYDHDGDPDLLVQEYGFLPYQPRYLRVLINDGDRWQAPRETSFPPVSRHTPPILADFDNDGRFDYFFGDSDFGGGRSALLVRDSRDGLVDKGREMGLWVGYNYTMAAVWADLNNDGWLDLVQCLAHNEGAWTESTIHLNEAGVFFSNVSRYVSPDLGPDSKAAVAVDVDNDGDLDLILGHTTAYSDVMPVSATGLDLVRNESQGGNWLAVRLEGMSSNRSALGAEISLHAGPRHWLQSVPNGVYWGTCQPPLMAHFGLGSATATDSLVVVWPGGRRENFGPQPVNTRLNLREGSAGKGSRKSRGPHRP